MSEYGYPSEFEQRYAALEAKVKRLRTALENIEDYGRRDIRKSMDESEEDMETMRNIAFAALEASSGTGDVNWGDMDWEASSRTKPEPLAEAIHDYWDHRSEKLP